MQQSITLVTGGSMGIGLAIVEQQVASGALVFNLDITNFNQPIDNATWIECDVSNLSLVKQAINKILQHSGRIDRLVCNAGLYVSANLEDTSEELLDKVIAVNIKGTYTVLKAVLPAMREQGSGAIVIMGSDQSLVGKRNSFAYGLSKAALASIVKSTALDYAEHNIRVNAVCPGTIETPLFHHAIDNYVAQSGQNKQHVLEQEGLAQPLGRVGKPSEVAALSGFLLSDDASFITGSLHPIDGGYTAQ